MAECALCPLRTHARVGVTAGGLGQHEGKIRAALGRFAHRQKNADRPHPILSGGGRAAITEASGAPDHRSDARDSLAMARCPMSRR